MWCFLCQILQPTPLCIYRVSMYVCYKDREVDGGLIKMITEKRRERGFCFCRVVESLKKKKRFLWDFIGVVARWRIN